MSGVPIKGFNQECSKCGKTDLKKAQLFEGTPGFVNLCGEQWGPKDMCPACFAYSEVNATRKYTQRNCRGCKKALPPDRYFKCHKCQRDIPDDDLEYEFVKAVYAPASRVADCG